MASKPIDIQLINIRPNDFYAKSLLNNGKPLVNISLELATKGHCWVEGSNFECSKNLSATIPNSIFQLLRRKKCQFRVNTEANGFHPNVWRVLEIWLFWDYLRCLSDWCNCICSFYFYFDMILVWSVETDIRLISNCMWLIYIKWIFVFSDLEPSIVSNDTFIYGCPTWSNMSEWTFLCSYDGGQQYLINKISPLRTTCHAHVDQRFNIWQVIW